MATTPPRSLAAGQLRRAESAELIATMKTWLWSQAVFKTLSIGDAAAYVVANWDRLTRFLGDARIPLDNNATERGIRGPVVGRKDHYGSRSRRGTEIASVFYSLLETAKLQHVDPARYLREAALADSRGEVSAPRQSAALALRIGLRRRAGYRIDAMEKAKLREKLTLSHDHPTAGDFRFGADRHTGVFTCRHVWTDGKPIVLVSHDEDGDWQFLCGDDHSEAAANDCLLVCLEHIVSRDPSVNELATMCTAHVATREGLGAPWTIEDRTSDDIRNVIDECGWWVGLIHSDGEAPAFAYTIGLYEKFGHPEIIIFGLAPESMHGILNRCGEMIRGGKRFPVGESVSEVLDGYDVRFRAVTAKASYAEYLGYGCRHYGDQVFPVLQLIWPDKQHRFPGDDAADDFLAKRQPLLE